MKVVLRLASDNFLSFNTPSKSMMLCSYLIWHPDKHLSKQSMKRTTGYTKTLQRVVRPTLISSSNCNSYTTCTVRVLKIYWSAWPAYRPAPRTDLSELVEAPVHRKMSVTYKYNAKKGSAEQKFGQVWLQRPFKALWELLVIVFNPSSLSAYAIHIASINMFKLERLELGQWRDEDGRMVDFRTDPEKRSHSQKELRQRLQYSSYLSFDNCIIVSTSTPSSLTSVSKPHTRDFKVSTRSSS